MNNKARSNKFISEADANAAASWWNSLPGGKKRYYKEHSKLTTDDKVARYWLANVKDMAPRQAVTIRPEFNMRVFEFSDQAIAAIAAMERSVKAQVAALEAKGYTVTHCQDSILAVKKAGK